MGTGRVALIAIVSIGLAGCAVSPRDFVSVEGSRLIVSSKDTFEYRKPDGSLAICRYGSREDNLARCSDGTASTMSFAGLPFQLPQLIIFDGRQFIHREGITPTP